MKTKILLLALAAFALALAVPARAAMQTFGVTQFTSTNVLEGATNYIVATNSVLLTKDRGIGLTASLTPGAATNVAEIKFQTSPDGTLWAWSTPHVLYLNLTSVGTNYIMSTNLSANVLNNAKYIRLYSIGTVNTNKLTNAIYFSQHY